MIHKTKDLSPDHGATAPEGLGDNGVGLFIGDRLAPSGAESRRGISALTRSPVPQSRCATISPAPGAGVGSRADAPLKSQDTLEKIQWTDMR